jgi:deoxyribonuclease-4
MFGSHLSVAGGLHNALLAAEKLRLHTVQVFTANPKGFNLLPAADNTWSPKPLDPAAVHAFRSHADRLGFSSIVSHASYLINLAAKDDALWEKSVAAFAAEMQRCDDLAIPLLVVHPGAHCGTGEACGIDRVVAALRRLLRDSPNGRVTICLETTAGQGTCLGCSFDHLAAMIAGAGHHPRLAVCVDTCHILAAGYDVTTADSTRAVLAELDRIVGLPRVKAWHLNDSKKPRASKVDRHEHIGRGCVGLPAFAVIAADPRFANVPKILETPKDKAPDGRDWDDVNLDLLRKLAAGKKARVINFEKKAKRAKARHAR